MEPKGDTGVFGLRQPAPASWGVILSEGQIPESESQSRMSGFPWPQRACRPHEAFRLGRHAGALAAKGSQITRSCLQSLRAAKRRSDCLDCFADPVIGRRLAPNRCHIYVRGYRNQRRMCLLLRAAAISESCALRWAQGNRDEENSYCRTDRRIIYFGRGKSSRSCWRCCLGRGVGGGRPGTCGRGGGCVHWIHSRAFDRAFLGTWAVRIAISGATYSTIQPRNPSAWNPRGWSPRASRRQGKFAASCQISRDASREESRAAGSGI